MSSNQIFDYIGVTISRSSHERSVAIICACVNDCAFCDSFVNSSSVTILTGSKKLSLVVKRSIELCVEIIFNSR